MEGKEMTLNQKIIKPKLGLLELAKQLGSVSTACKTMGYSRDSYYRFRDLYEKGGEAALYEISQKKPLLANRTRSPKNSFRIILGTPDRRKYWVSGSRDGNCSTSLWAVESIQWTQATGDIDLSWRGAIGWPRQDLNNLKKRLQALEAKVAQEGILLTEAQLQALERRKEAREAHGEIETEHPGYLGSQDTYYVGTFKGVGSVYQQTFIDTYSRVAHTKLYTEKTAITAADLLNDKVLPWYEEQAVPLLRILTDRGSEFCGKVEHHAYELFLSIEGIDHSRTKAYAPQTNGICERFNRTMKEEFFDSAFRKKIYASIAELQQDADQWLYSYNYYRPHSGKFCYGKTPMQTFLDAKHIVLEKNNQVVYENNLSDSFHSNKNVLLLT